MYYESVSNVLATLLKTNEGAQQLLIWEHDCTAHYELNIKHILELIYIYSVALDTT